MDPLHRQAVQDCYDDIARDMDPKWVMPYSTVRWRDEDPGFIRAKRGTEGPEAGARAMLDRLMDLPSDGFDDFVESLKEAKYIHLVEQLLETRERLKIAVERGEIRRRDLGRRQQDVTRRTKRSLAALAILVTSFVICTWICTLYYGSGSRIHDSVFLAAFPRRLKTFVGREDVFNKIDACLQENQTCLIKGLGGVGKTSVAIEYGHRRAERYPGGVFWVGLASNGDLCASISRYSSYITDSLQLKDDLSCKDMKMYLRRYLTSSQDWLLVVDEAVRNTMKELESILPHTLKFTMHVLLTSKEYQRLDNERIPVVNLPPFSETEAQAMFNKTVRPSSENHKREIKRLSRSLGHHPLALQLACTYIEETGCSVKEYHDKYTGGNAAEKVGLLDECFVEQVANRRIEDIIEGAVVTSSAYVSLLPRDLPYKLLDMASFMGPDCIPCPNPNSIGFQQLFLSSGKLDELDVKKMVSVLEKNSLVSSCHAFQPCAFSVNRIVQEVVVAQMNESTRAAHLEDALKYSTLLLEYFDSNDTTRNQTEFLMVHLHYLARNILLLDRYQLSVSVNRSSEFLNKSAEFFYRWGACEEAFFFLHAEILLFVKHDIQNLCSNVRDHVAFQNTTLSPCLFNGDVPVDLLVDIAQKYMYWVVLTDLMQPSSSVTASCDRYHVLHSLLNTNHTFYELSLSRKSRKLNKFHVLVHLIAYNLILKTHLM
ncbi:uncharacterized protein LOC144866926 [Branchiostoma floridae x Branchiostoma japonicum]